MNKDLQRLTIHPFSIAAETEGNAPNPFYESVFSQGNGYMGVRGYAPLQAKRNNHERSVFAAGVFEYIKPGITDMVNLPDIFSAKIDIAAKEMRADLCMDMQNGLFAKTALWKTEGGEAIQIVTRRFLSIDNVHCAAMAVSITPLDGDLPFTMEAGIDGNVENLPVSDDQMAGNTATHRLLRPVLAEMNGMGGALVTQTVHSGRQIMQAFEVRTNRPVETKEAASDEGYIALSMAGTIPRGETFTMEKSIATYTYRDDGADIHAAQALAASMAEKGFNALLRESAAAYEALWKQCDIEIDCEGDLQGAIRYNIFQLLQNDAAHDPRASIGARGLMHGRYKGNYFWDTEMFMLPFYLYTNPEAARNLLLYRYHTLADAKQGARGMNLKGARYPWMCSDTGFEQCETWDTGCCEVHITADIAYAITNYVSITHDYDFLHSAGLEMLIETARYWVSRLTYNAQQDTYNLLFVKGPDEYCGVTTNNTYTNYLVRENLLHASMAGESLRQQDAATWDALAAKTGVTPEELQSFRAVADKVPILYDQERELFIEDELFERLEPLDIASHKQGHAPLYRTMSYDRLQRYKVLKQADLVLLMTLYPSRFSWEQKENVWRYYEPLTLHDSTLSFGTHSQLAFQLGYPEKAMDYLQKSAYLDLHNVMDNTHNEGIHTAALGATWQAVVFGMAGLQKGENGFALTPCLPEGVRGLKFAFFSEGEQYRAKVTPEGGSIERMS